MYVHTYMQRGKHASLTTPLCHLERLRALAVIVRHVNSHPIAKLAEYLYHLRQFSEASKHLPKKCANDEVVGLLQVDETQTRTAVRTLLLSSMKQLLQPAHRERNIRRRAVRAEPNRRGSDESRLTRDVI